MGVCLTLWIHPLLVFQESSWIFIFAVGNFPGFEGQTYMYIPHHVLLVMLEVFSIQAL